MSQVLRNRKSSISVGALGSSGIWDPGLKDGDEHQETIKEQPKVSETVASNYWNSQQQMGMLGMYGNIWQPCWT